MPPLEFRHAETGLSVVIDDDGRVAYAYLRDLEGDIIGDVWLYNREVDPKADWADPSQAPFPNPRSHARPFEGRLPSRASDFSVEWTLADQLLLCDVSVHGVRLARLSPGAAPGWNVLALAEGPCALPWPSA
jgi:hypothetical protein